MAVEIKIYTNLSHSQVFPCSWSRSCFCFGAMYSKQIGYELCVDDKMHFTYELFGHIDAHLHINDILWSVSALLNNRYSFGHLSSYCKWVHSFKMIKIIRSSLAHTLPTIQNALCWLDYEILAVLGWRQSNFPSFCQHPKSASMAMVEHGISPYKLAEKIVLVSFASFVWRISTWFAFEVSVFI